MWQSRCAEPLHCPSSILGWYWTCWGAQSLANEPSPYVWCNLDGFPNLHYSSSWRRRQRSKTWCSLGQLFPPSLWCFLHNFVNSAQTVWMKNFVLEFRCGGLIEIIFIFIIFIAFKSAKCFPVRGGHQKLHQRSSYLSTLYHIIKGYAIRDMIWLLIWVISEIQNYNCTHSEPGAS